MPGDCIGKPVQRKVFSLDQMLEDAFPLIVCDVEFPAGQFDDTGNIFGVHFGLGSILHQADHLGKTCLFHGGPDGILDLQDKGFVIRSQSLF